MTHLTSSNEFYANLRTFKSSSESTIAVLFHASWVEGCSQLIETVEALQEEYEESVKFLTVEADKLTDLSQTFNISKLPSVLFFTNKSNASENVAKKIISPSSDQLVAAVESIVEEGILNFDNIGGENIPSDIDAILKSQQANQAAANANKEKIDPQQALNDKLKSVINQSKFMIFIKGTPDAAKCGFSRQLLEIMVEQDVDFGYFDILEDDEVRQGLKKYSDWPTYWFFRGILPGILFFIFFFNFLFF